MALKGVLRPGYIQIRVTDLDVALTHYVDRVGLHEVSREADGRVYLRAWDEFDRHSVVLRQAAMPGMDTRGSRLQAIPISTPWHAGLRNTAPRSRKWGGRRATGPRTPPELHRADRPSDRVVLGDGAIQSRADDPQP
jgi:hypothetical protein